MSDASETTLIRQFDHERRSTKDRREIILPAMSSLIIPACIPNLNTAPPSTSSTDTLSPTPSSSNRIIDQSKASSRFSPQRQQQTPAEARDQSALLAAASLRSFNPSLWSPQQSSVPKQDTSSPLTSPFDVHALRRALKEQQADHQRQVDAAHKASQMKSQLQQDLHTADVERRQARAEEAAAQVAKQQALRKAGETALKTVIAQVQTSLKALITAFNSNPQSADVVKKIEQRKQMGTNLATKIKDLLTKPGEYNDAAQAELEKLGKALCTDVDAMTAKIQESPPSPKTPPKAPAPTDTNTPPNTTGQPSTTPPAPSKATPTPPPQTKPDAAGGAGAAGNAVLSRDYPVQGAAAAVEEYERCMKMVTKNKVVFDQLDADDALKDYRKAFTTFFNQLPNSKQELDGFAADFLLLIRAAEQPSPAAVNQLFAAATLRALRKAKDALLSPQGQAAIQAAEKHKAKTFLSYGVYTFAKGLLTSSLQASWKDRGSKRDPAVQRAYVTIRLWQQLYALGIKRYAKLVKAVLFERSPFLAGLTPSESDLAALPPDEQAPALARRYGMRPDMKPADYFDQVENLSRMYSAMAELPCNDPTLAQAPPLVPTQDLWSLLADLANRPPANGVAPTMLSALLRISGHRLLALYNKPMRTLLQTFQTALLPSLRASATSPAEQDQVKDLQFLLSNVGTWVALPTLYIPANDGDPTPGSTVAAASSGTTLSQAANVFGGATATAGFGQSVGVKPATNVFGTTGAQTGSGSFGTSGAKPAFGASTSTSAFGTSTAKPAFGTGATTSGFGTSTATPGFGSSTATPAFGQAGAGATSVFGKSGFDASTQQSSGFGTSNQQPNFGQSAASTGFGTSTQQPAFGQSNGFAAAAAAGSAQPSTGLFGKSNAVNTSFSQTSGGMFGNGGQSTGFGNTSFGQTPGGFGQSSSAGTSSLFSRRK